MCNKSRGDDLRTTCDISCYACYNRCSTRSSLRDGWNEKENPDFILSYSISRPRIIFSVQFAVSKTDRLLDV